MKICSCQAISCHQEASFVTRRHLPTIRITFGGQNIESLLDTGAMIALLDFELGQGLPLELVHRTDKSIPAFSCSGEKLQIMGSILSHLSFNRHMPPIWAEFYLLKNSTQRCIIPHPWLEQLSATINYNTSTLSFIMPKKGFFLSAEGPLQKSNLKYKEKYKYKSRNTNTMQLNLGIFSAFFSNRNFTINNININIAGPRENAGQGFYIVAVR